MVGDNITRRGQGKFAESWENLENLPRESDGTRCRVFFWGRNLGGSAWDITQHSWWWVVSGDESTLEIPINHSGEGDRGFKVKIWGSGTKNDIGPYIVIFKVYINWYKLCWGIICTQIWRTMEVNQ
jgi:hypothetical protein